MNGERLQDKAPLLFASCTRRNITVAQALADHRWTRHLRHELEPDALIQAVQLWEMLHQVNLQPEIEEDRKSVV